MGPPADMPLLPGDWEPVEQQAAIERQARRERAQIEREARRERDHESQRLELAAEFQEWLRESEYEPDEVMASTRTIRTLLRLKSQELDSTDPLEWSEELVRKLVTEVFPRELPEGLDDPQDAATDLLLFVGFLDATGRWRKRPLRSGEATLLLMSIAYPNPEDWGPGIALT